MEKLSKLNTLSWSGQHARIFSREDLDRPAENKQKCKGEESSHETYDSKRGNSEQLHIHCYGNSKRLNDLEASAMSYPGVTKTYAIQAGRELRVIVGADKMNDAEAEALSGDIATKIQNEMTYPGQVKITVIRETRSVAYAK